jgi:phosphomannomutase
MHKKWPTLIRGGEICGPAADNDTPPDITSDLAKCLGYAFALWLAERRGVSSDALTIAVGRDNRPTGEALAQSAIRGLTAADCDVYDAGITTTAALCLTLELQSARADGALMVTAGHLPADYNGFKLMTREGPLCPDDQKAVLERAGTLMVPRRLVTELDALCLYEDHLADMLRRRLDDDVQCPLVGLFAVVATGGAGAAFAGIIENLGADVVRIELPPGPFSPDDPRITGALARAVLENEADLGVALDDDGTRAALVDESGLPLVRNRLIALMAALLLEESPGATFVTDSVTSSGVARFITEWGGVHYRYKRGHRNVIDEAVRLNEEDIDCPLAIETSGHAAMRENYFLDDGAYLAAVVMCGAHKMKRHGQTLSDLIRELAEPVESAEIRMGIHAPDYRAAAQSAIEIVLSHTLDNPEWRLASDNREGVRINFDLDGEMDNAWLLLRLSVHEPVMPLNVESDVPGGVRRILGQLYELIRKDEDLDLKPLRAALDNSAPRPPE